MAGRWNEIAGALRASIEGGGLKPGDRLPSETDLAAQWQVCRMTAHRALHELHREGLVTRRRRIGTVVAAPSAKRASTIALLFFHNNNFPQVEYIHGIRAALPDDCNLLFFDTRNDPQREAQILRRMQTDADGIVCFPTNVPLNTPLLCRLRESGMPVVCVDRAPEGAGLDAVVTDNYGSSREALCRLREQGHRRIAHFTEEKMHISSVRERHAAYREVMVEAGHADPARWERRFPASLGRDFDQMAQAVHDALFTLLHQHDPPTAVFCLEDYYLGAVLEACDTMRVSVPNDLEVLSFSDCPPMVLRLSRDVHRIVQRAYRMGQLAAERLLQRMAGDTSPAEVVRVPADYHPAGACITTRGASPL